MWSLEVKFLPVCENYPVNIIHIAVAIKSTFIRVTLELFKTSHIWFM